MSPQNQFFNDSTCTMTPKQQFQLLHPDAYCRVDQYDNYHINSTNDEGRPTKYGYSIVSEVEAWQNALNNIENNTTTHP